MTNNSKQNPPAIQPAAVRTKVVAIIEQLDGAFIKRRDAIVASVLALIIGEHFLLVGPPGTGKTAISDRLFSHVECSYFSEILGSFTPPDELYGPVDIKSFQAGSWGRVTTGMLPECDMAMLDEVFKGSDGIVNSMLKVLNERQFRGRKIPLRTAGSATNWPEIDARNERVNALYDRLLLRCIVDDLTDEADVVAMLAAGERVEKYAPAVKLTLAELDAAKADIEKIAMGEGARALMHSVRERLGEKKEANGLRKSGVEISGRRLIKLQRVLRASAWLAGRTEVGVADFDVLRFGLWNDRADYDRVTAVLETIDAKEVKRLVEMIDDARSEFEAVKRKGYGMSQVNALTQKTRKVVVEVHDRLMQPLFTPAGRDKVVKASNGLKECFRELNRRVRTDGDQSEEA